VVVYRRQSANPPQIALVFLNFSDQPQSITAPFPEPGTYREVLDQDSQTTPFDLTVSNSEELMQIAVPSHYGAVFIK
jgi:maltooligosyltrehalose trehalohydrolase